MSMSPRSCFPFISLAALVLLLGCGTGGSDTAKGPVPKTHATPTITSISPPSATAGSDAINITITGSNFDSFSIVEWNLGENGPPLHTTYVNPTTLMAHVPAALLTSVGLGNDVTVGEFYYGQPGPVSESRLFQIIPPLAQGESVIGVAANDLAWDPLHQVIYLSLASPVNATTSTVQVLDPFTGVLGKSVTAGNGADLLSISKSSKYLYVGLDGAPSVQRLTLPNLERDIEIPLGSDPFYGPYYAMGLQAGPASDETVAIVRGVSGRSPRELGGVGIYDNATPRHDALCGFGKSGCSVSYSGPCCFSSQQVIYSSIQWNAAGDEMFAVDPGTFDFYTMPVTNTGFQTPTNHFSLAASDQSLINSGYSIHYDPTTNYVYDDNGTVIDPVAGTKVGTFHASGLMVPDGSLGVAFFLGQESKGNGTTSYTLESFDIHNFTPIATLTVTNVSGTPMHLIRWGTDGLAFSTAGPPSSDARVYLVQGSFVDGSKSNLSSKPTQNVQRTWKPYSQPAHSLIGSEFLNQ